MGKGNRAVTAGKMSNKKETSHGFPPVGCNTIKKAIHLQTAFAVSLMVCLRYKFQVVIEMADIGLAGCACSKGNYLLNRHVKVNI